MNKPASPDKPEPMPVDVVEKAAKAIWQDMLKTGQANDLRNWERRAWKDGDWDCQTPALDDETKDRIRSAAAAALSQSSASKADSGEALLREAREQLNDTSALTGNLEWKADLGKLVDRIDTHLQQGQSR